MEVAGMVTHCHAFVLLPVHPQSVLSLLLPMLLLPLSPLRIIETATDSLKRNP